MGNSNGSELPSTSCDCTDERTHGNAAQCLSRLYLSEHLSDINIVFSKDRSVRLPAHKFVLRMRSKKFRDLLSTGQNTIDIISVEPEIMKVLLRFIYSDDPEINSSNVLPCWHAAKLFALCGLVQKCNNFLENTIDVINVWQHNSHAISYGIKPLEEKCLSFILENAANVLFTPGFLELSLASLLNILMQDELAADEVEVFKAAMKWAEHQCETKKRSKTGRNMRDQLKEAMFEIRFATIPIPEIIGVVTPSGILTKDERLMLLEYIAKPDTEPPPEIKKFCKRKRTGVPITTDRRRHDSSEIEDEEIENE
ncbi:BTB/POZ domain-containing protein 6-B-like [Ruditapes philippinarum]|uniref:BTB/POZ domain-containing protein 6-B-like n=1 Tax=Ruditapes philippinarum TaxID=129788 RepID=UPI00295B5E35|nr:BTB/POZ domain-containing protein 6-B-like [Ruditapes philippinarum]